ncbi:fumarylacetoacetate hydrolase family protein [bacterium]|nr:fumarylacetoacetate hydrolase family protein [bacterium]
MKFVRFEYEENTFFGLLEGQQIEIWSKAPWDYGQASGQTVTLDEVTLLSPSVPGKVIATAVNYPGATGLTEKTKEPLVFLKPSTSVIGPEESIVSPFPEIEAWGECELALVIGKKISKADISEAKGAIFGYTIGNDVSCENVFGWDHHLARSKGADTFCVLGPWIDTDFDPKGKYICGYHNDILIREGYCNERIWQEPELLVWLSSWITLEPGDVILTGAPSRVRERLYFLDGDRFTVKIDGLGELSNPFFQS